MTLGELAFMTDADEHLGVDLDVVRVAGWARADDWMHTGLRWVAPSPNLRTERALLLYPGVALVEGTNVSVGRGTPTPFELLGAPFIDGAGFAERLESLHLPGVRFSEAHFTPRASVHAGIPCGGVHLTVTDAALFDPVHTGLALAIELRRAYPSAWDPSRLDDLLANPEVTRAVLEQRPLSEVEDLSRAALLAFRAKREKYLLYR
jgi:uncharacterized protein YbbC (DUF1343 family)